MNTSIFLSYRSSLRYWRSNDPYYRDQVLVSPAEGVDFNTCSASLCNLEDYTHLFAGDGPIDVIVNSRKALRKAERLDIRFVGVPLPEGCFYRVRKHVYACSPELIFLLAASDLSLRSLITLGFELCGTYSLFNGTDTGSEHGRITSVAQIDAFLKQVPKFRGIKMARRALRYVADGSASPRETDLYMMLCLPPSLGGFGLKNAALNSLKDVSTNAQTMTTMKHITPDLSWSKPNVVVEFESTQSHGAYISPIELFRQNKRKLADDSRRRRTYEAMKIKVVTVTGGEFESFTDMDHIARLLTRLIGQHGIVHSKKADLERAALHEWLKVPAEKRAEIV